MLGPHLKILWSKVYFLSLTTKQDISVLLCIAWSWGKVTHKNLFPYSSNMYFIVIILKSCARALYSDCIGKCPTVWHRYWCWRILLYHHRPLNVSFFWIGFMKYYWYDLKKPGGIFFQNVNFCLAFNEIIMILDNIWLFPQSS